MSSARRIVVKVWPKRHGWPIPVQIVSTHANSSSGRFFRYEWPGGTRLTVQLEPTAETMIEKLERLKLDVDKALGKAR